MGTTTPLLTALLEVAFKDVHEGIYIQTWHGGGFLYCGSFQVQYLYYQTLREMLFFDDSALVPHSAADMQVLVNHFAEATAQFSLKINIKKTECIDQPIKIIYPLREPEAIMIGRLRCINRPEKYFYED